MRQRALASSLTGLSMALGVAVMICVIVIHSVTVKQFSQDAQGYHLIVGSGKGSPLELVLSTVFHLGKPLYPIPYASYREFTDGRFADVTSVAVPYCLGDSYVAGDNVYRVIATTPDLFGKIQYGTKKDGTPEFYQFSSGRNFKNENCLEAVVGSVVANQTGLGEGDEFNPTHGIGADGDKHNAFKVVGVLAPTGTANDRAVFVNIEGFFLIEDHALTARDPAPPGRQAILGADVAARKRWSVGDRIDPAEQTKSEDEDAYHVVGILPPTGIDSDRAIFTDPTDFYLPEVIGEEPSAAENKSAEESKGTVPPAMCYDNDGNEIAPLPEPQREVTSILVLCSNKFGPNILLTKINKDNASPAQAVAPAGVVIALLESIIKPVQIVLLVLTVLIVVVASISILVSIYNSMSERMHDIAVMRALGASRSAVMLIILFESILLAVCGGLAGFVLGHGLVAIAAPIVEAHSGISLNFFEFDAWELTILPSLIVLASLVGLAPALSAYRTDVAKSLGGLRQ